MAELTLNFVPRDLRDTATFATAALHALAREEARERKPLRLLEPGFATWAQFRGRLLATDLLELLLEDAAVTQPSAFVLPAELGHPSALPQGAIHEWIAALADLDLSGPSTDYVTDQARRLGVPTRMARSDLHRVKPQHQILELPGSGAQLAHHLVTTHDDIYLQSNFVVACRDWRDAQLAGLVGVELGISGPAPVVMDPDLRTTRATEQRFDYVIGLHPEKGGDFRVDSLEEWFPGATVLLV